MPTALNDLKEALHELEPTGATGFEGLMAQVLTVLSGQTFRLASSGLQLGLDGATSASDAQIAFEAKLYTGKINKNDVLGKIPAIISATSPVDLWVVGATIEANTQLTAPLEATAQETGLSVLILDWPAATDFPKLALACALAEDATVEFLSANVDASTGHKARAAIATLTSAPGFTDAAAPLVEEVSAPTLGLPLARKANRAQLLPIFSDERQAKAAFGQVLAPGSVRPMPLQPRDHLIEKVGAAFSKPIENDIVIVDGDEGCGKSWAIAQAWRSSPEPPLMVLLPATSIPGGTGRTEIESILLSGLIEQTGDEPAGWVRQRWIRRFARWRAAARPEQPRFMLVIDGLNQHPTVRWAHWLDAAASVVEALGGSLVVSCRTKFFADNLRGNLLSQVRRITVSEWSESELDSILGEVGLSSAELQEDVRQRLRNPRLLSVAIELIASKHITDLRELTVGRLLFEHIRAGARDGVTLEDVDVFVRRLREHAREVLDRVTSQQIDDRLVFEGSKEDPLSARLQAATGEHFFQPLTDDPTLYQMSESALELALGLALLAALAKAQRNGKDVRAALTDLLEPVAALDKTADAVSAALQVAAADDRCSHPVRAALIAEYLTLQNISDAARRPFAASVRRMLPAALNAMEHIATSPTYVAHSEWLIETLVALRQQEEAWTTMAPAISGWLRAYSLDPTLRVHTPKSEQARYDQELAEARVRLSSVWEGLPKLERDLFKLEMNRRDGINPGELHRIAFRLLAGKPLAGFAEDLVCFSLSNSLNSSLNSPDDDFVALVRFNSRDWAATRKAMVEAARRLEIADASSTAQWAHVAVLRGLATPEDSEKEYALVEELTKDREKWPGWRLVEDYCANDPCDPSSGEPENVANTAARYLEIDVSAVCNETATGDAGHFFRDGRPGVARFHPEPAVELTRRFTSDVLTRKDRPLFLGLAELRKHAALLTQEHVHRLLEIANELSSARPEPEDDGSYPWISSQFALALAFTHLEGDLQLKALVDLPPHGPPILTLCQLVKPAESQHLEEALQSAIVSGDDNRKLAVLLFAGCSKSTFSERSIELVLSLARDDSSAVRAQAFFIVAQLGRPDLIKDFSASNWTTAALDRHKNWYEVWYGSNLIILGAKLGYLGAEDVLQRIPFSRFGAAARELGSAIAEPLAALFNVALDRALALKLTHDAPAVETTITDDSTGDAPPRLSVSDIPAANTNDALKRLAETETDFSARQREAWRRYRSFEEMISQADAWVIVEEPSRTAIGTCVEFVPGWGEAAARKLLAAKDAYLAEAKNFALVLAESLAANAPDVGRELFEAAANANSTMNLVHGPAEIPLEVICAWRANDGGAWDDLRTSRLIAAWSDHQLAVEVLGALAAGKGELVEAYALALIEDTKPVNVARGLIILGYGPLSSTADTILGKFSTSKGLIGDAARAALESYKRNSWAGHWRAEMDMADTPEQYWRASALLRKLVDGRLEFEPRAERRSTFASSFDPLLDEGLKHRIKAWKSKRERLLMGRNAPPCFVLAQRPASDAE